ncbi:hypothetical protein C8F01DRAFT_1226435 [Mycena amicta]|nr:hypothetical protein C8F01DRAFT_1226435 [Mycena amicta]
MKNSASLEIRVIQKEEDVRLFQELKGPAHGQLVEDERLGDTVPLASPPRERSAQTPSSNRESQSAPPQQQTPIRDVSSRLSPESSPPIVVKEEQLDVVIKQEGEADYFTYVSLIKSESGGYDLWNVNAFNLGPPVQVDAKYRGKGWTRKVISDAFGGNHQVIEHHFSEKATKTPFLTVQRSWNHALPILPGEHGMGFFGLNGCRITPEPINIFVGEGPNDWRLLGTYDYLRYGEIAHRHVPLLPPKVLDTWVKGMVENAQWGKESIAEANKYVVDDDLKVEQTEESVRAAFLDGRLVMPFTILKCVRFPVDWFEKLEYAAANSHAQDIQIQEASCTQKIVKIAQEASQEGRG